MYLGIIINFFNKKKSYLYIILIIKDNKINQ